MQLLRQAAAVEEPPPERVDEHLHVATPVAWIVPHVFHVEELAARRQHAGDLLEHGVQILDAAKHVRGDNSVHVATLDVVQRAAVLHEKHLEEHGNARQLSAQIRCRERVAIHGYEVTVPRVEGEIRTGARADLEYPDEPQVAQVPVARDDRLELAE